MDAPIEPGDAPRAGRALVRVAGARADEPGLYAETDDIEKLRAAYHADRPVWIHFTPARDDSDEDIQHFQVIVTASSILEPPP